ncbi:hypothetical protein C2G38_2233531 [Gigaspora rosea]|uniref:Uncharacterized protein n=1 Tax=Gigaspora rosea TaxID=44941 RepID=A0A397TR43_9GLOM|nr:hypothetical protein C2G38_2233531 [Gigaspora rosea]
MKLESKGSCYLSGEGIGGCYYNGIGVKKAAEMARFTNMELELKGQKKLIIIGLVLVNVSLEFVVQSIVIVTI